MRAFGKYRLIERIASGGMADVWRAEAPGPEGFVKEVALKLVRGDHDERDEFVRMFIQEARLASRLTHANIVQVFEFDQIGGRYYLAMELVHGRPLSDVVSRCRERGVRLGLPRTVHVCAEVARALGYAHRLEVDGRPAGLVHRDVSPQNVLLSYEGEVKLTDFGIARAFGSAGLTEPGTIKGKLAYMAPEQARAEPVDARADVFSLGVLLWELCTGRRLFARDCDAATLAALLSDAPVSPPSSWNEAVPPELDALASAALQRDPARRTASAEEMADGLASIRLQIASSHEELDLRAWMRRLWPDAALARLPGSASRSDAGRPEASATAELITRTAPLPPRRSQRRGKAALAAAAASALALGGGVGALRAWRARGAPEREGARTGALAPSPSAPDASGAAGAGPRAPGDASPAPAAPLAAHAREDRAVGEGEVSVRATPWAWVTIDDVEVGETPVARALPAGPHRLAARHPSLGRDEIVVNLAPGQRYVWKPKLAR